MIGFFTKFRERMMFILKAYIIGILMSFCLFTGLFASEASDNQLDGNELSEQAISSENKLNNQWAEEHLQGMNPDQLHIILNALHLSHTKALRSQFIQTLESALTVAKKDMPQLTSPGGDRQAKLKKLALLKVMSQKLKNTISQYRKIYAQIESMDSYLASLEATLRDPIRNALNNLLQREAMQARSSKEMTKIWGNYYQEVFHFMKETRKIGCSDYYKLMFSVEGVIPKEDRKENLPIPEK